MSYECPSRKDEGKDESGDVKNQDRCKTRETQALITKLIRSGDSIFENASIPQKIVDSVLAQYCKMVAFGECPAA